MKKFVCNLLLLFSLSRCMAQKDAVDDMAQLRSLNAKFIHNFVTNDTASHNKIIHKDFVCIAGNGKLMTRQEYLDGWAHGFDGFKYWDYRDEQISLFGNTALVHAKNKYVAEKDGKEFSGMSVYTDIYLKENGQWKCVQAQITRLAPENYSGDETIVKKWDYR